MGKESVAVRVKKNEPFFSTYQWQWWVICSNSIKLGVGGAPLEVLHQIHGFGGCSTFF
jgi:hypothetical protein